MSNSRSPNEVLKHFIVSFGWFCAIFTTYLPAAAYGDLCVTDTCDSETFRSRTAYVVAGLTVVGLAAAIAAMACASGHHKHHSRCSGLSSIDNYRPYSSSCSHSHHSHSHCSSYYSDCNSYYSDCSRDSDHHHHHHHSGSYDSNYYSDFHRNERSSFSSDGSDSPSINLLTARGKTNHSSHGITEEKSALSGYFIAHNSCGQEGNVTPFIQLPDGTTQSLGTLSLSGNGSIPYGPFNQKGTYTFGVSLDQLNESNGQLKLGSFQIEVNDATVQKVEFSAPPHARNNYEPAPVCYHLN